jgi:hypothetical protein
MRIAPPFGYKEVVPFLKTQKVRLLNAGDVPEFVQRGNAIPVSYTEFQPVAREYPIVFTTGDGGKTFAPVAVLGIGAGENLFYAGGAWARNVYVPAYARRRYPFCMAKVVRATGEQKDRLICVVAGPQRRPAEEPDAQGHSRAPLPAPRVARELRAPARAQGGARVAPSGCWRRRTARGRQPRAGAPNRCAGADRRSRSRARRP